MSDEQKPTKHTIFITGVYLEIVVEAGTKEDALDLVMEGYWDYSDMTINYDDSEYETMD